MIITTQLYTPSFSQLFSVFAPPSYLPSMMSDESHSILDSVSLSGSPDSEPDIEPIQAYSSEEISNLISATILCSACRAMLDHQAQYRERSALSYSARNEHHSSPERLRVAVLAGCQICTDLTRFRWWTPSGKDSDSNATRSELQMIKDSTDFNLNFKVYSEDPHSTLLHVLESFPRKRGL